MFQRASPRLLAYLALGLSIVIIGSSAIVIAYAQAPADVVVFYRTAIASLLVAAPFWRRVRTGPLKPGKGDVLLAALGGVLFTVNSYFWSRGIQLGGPTIPTLFANTSPLWVSLGALFLLRERLKPAFFGGLLAALAGAVVMLAAGGGLAGGSLQGALYGVFSAVFFGGFFLVSQRARRRLDALAYFWLSTAASALAALALVALSGSPLTGFPALTWLLFLALGLFTQVIGFLSISYTLGYLPASLVSPAQLLQLLVTAGLGRLFLHEALSWQQLAGGALVIAGVWAIIRSQEG